MKKIISHIITLVAAALTLLACNKKEMYLTDFPITMSLTEACSTKSLLDAETFETVGNQIKIYDYYTDGSAQRDGYYFNDLIQCASAGNWPFVEGGHKWTSDGIHKFFGWMIDDVNEKELFTPTFTESTKVVTIPETTLSPTTAQYDFMYSNIHERNLNTEPDYRVVPLEFNHMFTAFNIAGKDVALYNDYIIDYVELTGMVVTNSATIDYSVEGPNPTLTFGKGVTGDAYRLEHTGGIQLDANFKDLATGETTREYLLAWPQAARAIKLTIGYQAKDTSVEGSQYHSYTKTITLPYAWEPGKKNNLNLEFKDKEIALVYEVEPWNREPEEIDFSDEVMVDEDAHIKWDESSVQHVDYVNGEVIVFDDKNIEATCTFTILTPKGATWTASLISKEGHPDAFRLVDGSNYGNVGEESTIKLVVTNQDPISPKHVCELLITVQTADGRTIVVDDALTPEKAYDEETGTYVETTYTRFKIIQNFVN